MESAQSVSDPQLIQKGALLRILGVSFGLAVVIGNTIGAGILRAPGDIAHALGNGWLIFAAFMISLQLVISTYDGWYGAIYFAEEDSDPVRNLPRSMIGGVLAIIAIYLLINLAFLHALPLATFAQSKLPAADAVQVIFAAHSGQIITAVVLLSLPSSINAVLLMSTRIVFAMSRNNLLVTKAAEVNSGGTPGIGDDAGS